jgi:transposase InsO family protein
MDKIQDLVGEIPLVVPPLREINHEINLIDPEKRINYRLPKCPDALKPQLMDKINRYTSAGWWNPATARQAVPMLCIPKKNGNLRTVFDLRMQNDNTVKDVSPFPDQDAIRHDVARAAYRSKLDMSEAYEQIRIRPEDVHKTSFATIFGTFESQVMQQGDCNAPSTFQRFMTAVFREYIAKFVHVYLDDTFVYSSSIEEHEEHLDLVFRRLREARLYLSRDKVDLYSKRMDCLGHIITDDGIHASSDKMQTIRDWRQPRSYHEVQRFLGLVQYLAQFMPDITAYTTPLAGCARNNRPFIWTPLLEKCFDSIKVLASRAPILKPVDPTHPDPIWVICDGSKSGVGALYGQGHDWQTCRPAGFLSKKFSSAQQNYRTHEHETIAILEALIKWEDRLLGRKFVIVTDHKSLEYFETQPHLSPRQVRWWEYLSRFNFTVQHVDGESNRVADCLSRYYELDGPGDTHPDEEFVAADARLDPDGELLPAQRYVEIRTAVMRRSNRLKERVEQRVLDSQQMNNEGVATPETSPDNDLLAIESGADGQSLRVSVERDVNLARIVRKWYHEDTVFAKILQNPEAHPRFGISHGLIWTKNQLGRDVVCLPRKAFLRGRRLVEVIIDQAHTTIGHFGQLGTSKYIRRFYWWPSMGADIELFCSSCTSCQTTKDSTQKPQGLLHSLPIPTRPWQSIGMDFLGPLPQSNGHDYLLVVIDRLTSQVHLVPTTTRVTSKEVAWLFLKEVIRLHGVPDSIVSDRDTKFTSIFWRELQRLMGIKLLMSTAFHPQTDGATERANRSIGQVLRALVRNDQRDWADKCPIVEFALNSNISATTGYAPFELNHGFIPPLSQRLSVNTRFTGVKQFAQQALWNLTAAHDAIIESRVVQTHHANSTRRTGSTIAPGHLVYLSTKNLALPKGRAKKLLPKFIGPYKVVEANMPASTATLELPPDLMARRIHPTFHVNLLRTYVPNDSERFPRRDVKSFYDFGTDHEQEWFVDEILAHRWVDQDQLELQVRWTLGDVTWEPLAECKELEALDAYLELHGAKRPRELSRRSRTT